MKSLPWLITLAAVVAAVVVANWKRDSTSNSAMETPARLIASAAFDAEKSRPLDALRKLRKIPTSDRLSASARQTEGSAYLLLHFAGKAESHWLEALRQNPEADEAPYRLFDLYFLSGRHVEARRLAVELAPKQSDSAAAAMLLETIRQEHERAAAPVCLEFFEPVLVREPENGHAMRTVGRCFVELGRVTEGLLLLKSATETLSDDPETWAIRLESLGDTGRASQVVSHFNTAPAAVKRHPRTLRAVAAAHDSLGNAKEAEVKLLEALALDPYDRKIRTQLAASLERRGETVEAKKHVTRAKELDDLRERQAELFQLARRQKNNPGPELMRQLGEVCRELGWIDVAEQLDKLGLRRNATSMGAAGR